MREGEHGGNGYSTGVMYRILHGADVRIRTDRKPK